MKSFLPTLFFVLLVTQICFGQWVQTSLDSCEISCFVAKDSNLFAGTFGGGLFRSIDNGENWYDATSNLNNQWVTSLAVIDSNLFAGTEGGVFISSNNGSSWTEVNVGLSNLKVHALAVNGSNLYAGAGDYNIDTTGGVFLSTNSGISWTPVTTGLPRGGKVVSLAVSENNVFAGVLGKMGGHMYLSIDTTTSWIEQELSGLNISSSGPNVIVATYWSDFTGDASRIYLSTNSGTTWISTILGCVYCDPPCVAISGTNLFVGGYWGYACRVVVSTDRGTNWTEVNEGLTDSNNVKSLFVCGAYLFAGTHNGVWRRPLSEIITDVEDIEKVPKDFLLSNNFPNPFNPSTKIKYSVPQLSNVVIKVFDVLGNEIETLVDEEKPAGTYELTWNAANLPSGVYFYQLRTGSSVQTKKMQLLK